MKLPPITIKQQDILKLLYKYRSANRIQLQEFMGHKNKRRIAEWLKDLREKRYVEWIYSTDFAEKTKPAIYYLGLNGVRYLKTVDEYPPVEVRKRYRESSRSPGFIAKSVLLADCCLNLAAKSKDNLSYSFVTQADYADPDNGYHFLAEELKPDLGYQRVEQTKRGTAIEDYLIVVFDAAAPRYKVRKRLKDYVTYLDEGGWRRRFDGSELMVHFACPSKAELIYAKRRTRTLLEDIGRDKRTHIRFATVEQVRLQGITGFIWEEI
jgi:Replication-relaxation